MKILTLTLNPAFDIHCHTDHFEPFHENLATVTDYEAGGKGVNISRALTVCGVPNTAIVVLGKENGGDFAARLREDGMDLRAVTVPGRIRENITLHTSDAPETRISFPGFSATPDLLARVGAEVDGLLEAGDFVTLTGRVPAGVPLGDVKRFLLRLKEKGARIVIDSRSFAMEDLIEVGPYLIKPNEEEIAACLGRAVETTEELIAAAGDLHTRGIGHVMISLGSHGAILVSDEGVASVTAPRIEALSTIGAGDSSIAGFLSGAVRGYPDRECLRYAVAYGSAACLTPGTRPPRKEDVERFLAQ